MNESIGNAQWTGTRGVACPHCDAEPNEPCRTVNGKIMDVHHHVRFIAFMNEVRKKND